MKLAIPFLAAFVVASPTNFGSEAIPLENWRVSADRPLHLTNFSQESDEISASARVSWNASPPPAEADPDALAALREPEGPPPPPAELPLESAEVPLEPAEVPLESAEVPFESVCHTLASVAQANGLPSGFLARLIWQESRFDPRAVSPAGAQGVAQFMPAVAAERGLRNPFDPLAALKHSARFLKEHFEFFGNLGLAAAAYNAGARRVMNWLARRGPLPNETRNYVKIITGHPPEKWIEPKEIELAVELPQRAPCDGIADLSRDAEAAKIAVQLEPPVAKVIADARAAASKVQVSARAKVKKKLATTKSRRERLLAKGRGGRDKAKVKLADNAGKR